MSDVLRLCALGEALALDLEMENKIRDHKYLIGHYHVTCTSMQKTNNYWVLNVVKNASKVDFNKEPIQY